MKITYTIFYIIVFMFFVIGVTVYITFLANTESTVYMISNPIRYGVERLPHIHTKIINIPVILNTDFDKNMALVCCQFIENLYYCDSNVDNVKTCKTFKYDKSIMAPENITNSSFGCIYHSGDTVMVVFRGTEVRFQEWIDNLSYYQVSSSQCTEYIPEFMSKKLDNWEDDSFSKIHRDTDIMVHSGWLKTSCELMSVVSETINQIYIKNPNIKIVFTGHSMGGCISTLLATEMATIYPDIQCILYTFATPRIGNRAFVDYTRSLTNLRNHRIVNLSDILPDLIAAVAPNFKDSKNLIFTITVVNCIILTPICYLYGIIIL
jgi:hypothetical protein